MGRDRLKENHKTGAHLRRKSLNAFFAPNDTGQSRTAGLVTMQIRRRMYESINYDGTSGPGSTD